MIRVTWTGRGWLSLPITFLSAMAAIRATFGNHGWTAVLAAVLVLLAGAAINYLVALRLNSAKTPQGRQWHPSGRQHTLWGMPMQDWSGVIVAMALVAVAIGVGVLVAPLAGWLTFAGMVVAAVTGYALSRRRAARRQAQQRARARPMDPREREFVETTMNALFGRDRTSGPRQGP